MGVKETECYFKNEARNKGWKGQGQARWIGRLKSEQPSTQAAFYRLDMYTKGFARGEQIDGENTQINNTCDVMSLQTKSRKVRVTAFQVQKENNKQQESWTKTDYHKGRCKDGFEEEQAQ